MIRNANDQLDQHEDLNTLLEESFERLSDLAGLADEPLGPEPVHVPERFTIDSADKASWAVRKIVEARTYAERVKSWAQAELRRAEREERWLLHRFGHELNVWLRRELGRRGGRCRSVNLPGGRLGLRLQPARLEVVDESCTIPWCKKHLVDAVRINVGVTWRAGEMLLLWQKQHAPDARVQVRLLQELLNEHVKQTGEIPAGTVFRPAEDRFYVM
jgi:hypothetical protein